jgi:hypothetical protein
MNVSKCFKICRRKYNNGWTYGEAHRIWRLQNRENKLNKGWVRPKFKEWIDALIVIK